MSTELFLTPDPSDERSFLLARSYLHMDSCHVWHLPKGFRTDFASVPRLLWPLLPPYGKHTKAAVVHDWLYRTRPLVEYTLLWRKYQAPVSRRYADNVFRQIMRDSGVGWLRRNVMWAGVRLGGWISWRRYWRASR